jgi:hypothetical protein
MGESLQRDLKDRGVWVVAFLQRGVLVACVSLQRGHARDLFFGHDVRVYDVMNGNVNQISLSPPLRSFSPKTKKWTRPHSSA